MTILVKGPYSRKDYINSQDNLEEQQETLRERIELIKNNAIMIALIVGILYCLGAIVYTFNTRYENDDTKLLFIIGGAVPIVIIAQIVYYFSVKPYNKQIKDLSDESERLEQDYHNNMVEVPLSEYIDRIEVKGDKVTFPPLDEIDERYLYDEWSHNPSDTDHSIRQIFRLYQDFYEKDRLYTRYTYIWISITREECLMLKAKR